MGIPSPTPFVATPPAGDKANFVVGSGLNGALQITGTGFFPGAAGVELFGPFNVVFGGTAGPNGNYSATLQLERSFDGGTTWFICGVGGGGSQAIYSTMNQDVSFIVVEVEKGVLYRLHCTVYASGTINWRISASGAPAISIGVNAGIF
jgi:hypothetical protein